MTTGAVRSVVLAERPGDTMARSCLAVVEAAVPDCPPGGVLVRADYLSCDPYLRLRMQDTFAVGEPVPARVVGRVLESRDPRWHAGDPVWGTLAWSEVVAADPEGLRPVLPGLASPSHAISVCGVPGLTAYVGMVEKGRPAAGETVVVSGAAGAVGSIAGQLAVLAGARVVGIVGDAERARHVVDGLGFHAAVVRDAVEPVAEALRRAAPEGVDVCFENVGGPAFEAVLGQLRPGARVVLCGLASGYDAGSRAVGGLMGLCGPEAVIHGLNVGRHLDRLEVVSAHLADLVRSGRLRFDEDVVEGIEHLPDAFLDMLAGRSLGKRLVKVVSE